MNKRLEVICKLSINWLIDWLIDEFIKPCTSNLLQPNVPDLLQHDSDLSLSSNQQQLAKNEDI